MGCCAINQIICTSLLLHCLQISSIGISRQSVIREYSAVIVNMANEREVSDFSASESEFVPSESSDSGSDNVEKNKEKNVQSKKVGY